MVTMVYPLIKPDSIVYMSYMLMMASGRKYVGSQSFGSWASAVAYALLPADPTLTVTARRRVARGSSGRWVVTPTFATAPGRGGRRDLRDYPGVCLPVDDRG